MTASDLEVVNFIIVGFSGANRQTPPVQIHTMTFNIPVADLGIHTEQTKQK
jgi:hypothetical protein